MSLIKQYSEILELLRYRKRFKQLTELSEKTSPNYRVLYDSLNSQEWSKDGNKIVLKKGYAGVALEGSSRSGKTWSGIYFIIYLATIRHKDDGCTINIYRATYNEFKTTLYDDFNRILTHFNLPNPFLNAKEIHVIKIEKTNINFLGDGKHGGGCDYAFFNESMMIKKSVFNQVIMRCRKFWWMDYNPSFTDHWVFESVISRSDVNFLRTTFKDNINHISSQELNTILSYEPWLPGSYEVDDGIIKYNGKEVSEKNQPPKHSINHEQGTADEFMWKVYGLGLRGALEGLVIPNYKVIDDIPAGAELLGYGTDFGKGGADPTTTVAFYYYDGAIIWDEILYQSRLRDSEHIDLLKKAGVKAEYNNFCDNSEPSKIRELQLAGYRNAKGLKKETIDYGLGLINDRPIRLTRRSKNIVEELGSYVFDDKGKPIDKFNHTIDAARYFYVGKFGAKNKGKGIVGVYY